MLVFRRFQYFFSVISLLFLCEILVKPIHQFWNQLFSLYDMFWNQLFCFYDLFWNQLFSLYDMFWNQLFSLYDLFWNQLFSLYDLFWNQLFSLYELFWNQLFSLYDLFWNQLFSLYDLFWNQLFSLYDKNERKGGTAIASLFKAFGQSRLGIDSTISRTAVRSSTTTPKRRSLSNTTNS